MNLASSKLYTPIIIKGVFNKFKIEYTIIGFILEFKVIFQ